MLEIPYSKKMVDAFLPAAGGSILAAGCVLRDGVADDTSVFTLSIHQCQNYPQFTPPSDLQTSRPSSE